MGDYYHLFAKSSFLEGMARTLDIGSTWDGYNVSQTPEEADQTAIFSDWVAVGADMRKAINSHGKANLAHGQQKEK